VRAVLGETFALLLSHLHLFTLIALTVWLPASLALNYIEFFQRGEAQPGRVLQVTLTMQLFLDPLVVAATLCALRRVKEGAPAGYWTSLADGVAAWARLVLIRFLVNALVAVPAVALVLLARAGASRPAAGGLGAALSVLVVLLLVRVALVEPVTVLGGGTVVSAWRRAAALSAGQRWQILATMVVLLVLVLGVGLLAGWAFRSIPTLNHFVLRVLADCALAVSRSVLTIALFLFYWRAERPAEPGTA
jgi:hypothetical protein